MKNGLYILIAIILSVSSIAAQDRPGSGDRKGFSLKNMMASQKEVPDSILNPDSLPISNRRVNAYRLSTLLGEPYEAPMDTFKLNFANTTLVEYNSLAVGYLANVGSAAQTKMFFERKEARDFIFADPYEYYITDPQNAEYYNTKIPYTNILYTTEGGGDSKNERLKGTLTMNFGKKINVGGDVDYIYSRGQYKNNGNKLLSYRLFGSYQSDRYGIYGYLSNYNFLTYENGGLANDSVITNPDDYFDGGRQQNDPKTYPIRYNVKAWNRVRGKQYFFSQRANFGFEREVKGQVDSLGNPVMKFIPVSSFIHTMEYQDNRRKFLTLEDENLDENYLNADGVPRVFELSSRVDDRTSWWSLKNTFALSLREGFQNWAKFGLTAYATFDKRKFQLPAEIPGLSYDPLIGSGIDPQPSTLNFPIKKVYDEFSTYIGAELSKQQGNILTYNARGEICLVGEDVGEFRINANLKTKFNLFKKEASIAAEGYLKNITPAFYLRHFHSRYFWWDNSFNKMQQLYVGAKINIESTRTQISGGVESIQKYVYINTDGMPQQNNGNIQVISARVKQDFMFRAFGWENEVAYQLSSDKSVLPLPQLSVYSNMYLHFKLAKVLMVQVGANMYYNTSYNAPYYEPATMQFQNQNDLKIGGYPLINAYANFNLKQARFFVMAYNLSSKFANPNYFSLAHYPLNPMVVKMGIAVTFNN